MHPKELRTAALALVAEGVNDCEISRRLGIPRSTVRDWRRPTYVPRVSPRRGQTCPRCWQSCAPLVLTSDDYAELLGLYLGDGHISAQARTHRLRLFLDARYPTIVAETDGLLRRVFPLNRVGRAVRHDGSMVILSAHHRHLACLFPQHGAGKKHERRILLEPWQVAHVQAAPWAFLRGCIRSDGCVFINRTGRYEYLTYHFRNRSADIRALFVDTCEGLGLCCRVSGDHVRINRRVCVNRLLEHVGTKR